MTERIKILTDLTLQGKMYVDTVDTEYEYDSTLTESQNDVKHLCKYIVNQEPKITEHSAFCGYFNFDGSVIGDAFRRGGHKNTDIALQKYYLKPIDNLSTMEWQHATADYKKVLEKGIMGIIRDINHSIEQHTEPNEIEFLQSLKKVAVSLIRWTEKCVKRVKELARKTSDTEARKRLKNLANALEYSPKNPPRTFYEAVLSIYVCFSADPDSVGTLDRYLTPFYENDIANGTLTEDEAKEYLQELFLMLQTSTHISSANFTRGGQSHFCIGGYLPNGEDGFNNLSMLIVEALTELPTYIPQITFRWTKKTPKSALYYMLDKERQDPHKRIAFTNDEKRIKCYTEICGIPYERAVSYTMVGCNEPAFLGAITGSNSKGNILKCIETLFHEKSEIIKSIDTFEDFYALFEIELYSDLNKIYAYDNMYNLERAKDINYISSLFFNDCIENAKSLTQGGGNYVIASPMLIGITNVIDSLCVIKQLVYDTKIIALNDLVLALKSNWQGYEDMHTLINKKCSFFGNDDTSSNQIAKMLYNSLYTYLKNKKNVFGYQFLVGDLLGYNEHHKWFGEKTKATPDGRFNGEMLKFGIGQSECKDKNGLTALLNSIAKCDKNAISCGSTVTNISLDKSLIENEDSFRKLVYVFEEYFKQGGTHFQLTYVSSEDLINAQKSPKDYQNLRVRVTGFSDYFVNLKESIQNDIIKRTEQK